jgi:hypothetical protein
MLAAYLMTTVDEPSSCCEPTRAATTASVPMAPTVSLKRRFVRLERAGGTIGTLRRPPAAVPRGSAVW